jgi:hypothetical protein
VARKSKEEACRVGIGAGSGDGIGPFIHSFIRPIPVMADAPASATEPSVPDNKTPVPIHVQYSALSPPGLRVTCRGPGCTRTATRAATCIVAGEMQSLPVCSMLCGNTALLPGLARFGHLAVAAESLNLLARLRAGAVTVGSHTTRILDAHIADVQTLIAQLVADEPYNFDAVACRLRTVWKQIDDGAVVSLSKDGAAVGAEHAADVAAWFADADVVDIDSVVASCGD